MTSHGIAPDKKKIEAISNIQTPMNTSQVKSFLGIVSYCHQFIANFSTITVSLRRLTEKESEIHMGKGATGSLSDTKTKIN